ncbi:MULTISPECIES: DUF6082 family protein [unclassified Streptomyces]|uniref:DUF6082 family protein n=1 Tax=unclassified Streptomyces TaxID=2593676 RepID=UPI003430B133
MTTQRHGTWGPAAATAAGLAFGAAVLTTLAMQRQRQDWLRRHAAEREAESLRARLADYQRLQLRLLGKALEDPDLAAVLSTVEVDSPTQRRQYLYANALYSNALFGYRTGVANLEELHGHLRVLVRNTIFREYWEATRHHRASLKGDSEEGRIGQMVDTLIRDLDEADSDQWWVVGELPPE